MICQYALEPILEEDGSRRQREKAAVGRLIVRLAGPTAEIGHNANGSPYIVGSEWYISVSHSRNFAALAWSDEPGIGIDIEEPRQSQLERVASKFLSDDELPRWTGRLLEAWTIKEAAFKALRTGPADLRLYKLPTAEGAGVTLDDRRIRILFTGFLKEGLHLSLVKA